MFRLRADTISGSLSRYLSLNINLSLVINQAKENA